MDEDRAQVFLERLSHVLREELREVATRHGLALAQLEVLRFLGRANRFSDTVSGMVDYLGSTKGTLSQTLHSLVRKGLVVRAADAEDGRVQHCRLTDAGLAVVEASGQASAFRDVGLEPEAVDQLERLLVDVLVARGGRAFGVCSSCAHHRRTDRGRRCSLLGVDLTEDDAARICKEHQANAA
jgi:MarR family transcriptional regulator, organic hydroperoxide resistance regulator